MKLKLMNTLIWVNSKGHFQGIFWTICSCFFSNLCDISIKLVGNELPAMQIAFFRLFFGFILLFPLLLYKGKSFIYMKSKKDHFLRIVVTLSAIICWIYGASQTSLPSITTISFVCPLLVLPLAYLFLGEKSNWKRMMSVGFGFLGVIVVAFFEKNTIGCISSTQLFHAGIIFLLLGAVLFAMSDILNKKMLISETLFSLLFYFYLGGTLIGFIPALFVWRHVSSENIFCLLILGTSGVLVLYCVLKAANSTEIASLAPYKYIELIFSILISYILFKEAVQVHTIIGALFIVPSSLLIAYHELGKEKTLKYYRISEPE